jgi:hypothetical protein
VGNLDDLLKPLKGLTEHFEKRKARSAEIGQALPVGHWCFGLIGLQSEVSEFVFPGIGEFRAVELPPGEVELAAALRNKGLFSAIGRYARGIRHELAVSKDIGEDPNKVFTVGWWILSALRVRSMADFLVAAVADRPWSAIAAITDGTCDAQLIEDVPHAFRFDSKVTITAQHLEWVRDRLTTFAELLEEPRFRLAVEALTTHAHQSSLRLVAASLWAGIEALLDVTTELRFRIAVLVASYLEERGDARVAVFAKCKNLYDQRSLAIHGGKIEDDALRAHVLEVRVMLSRLLCRMVEEGRVPTPKDYERHLLA